MKDPKLTPQYVGLSNPRYIFVYSKPNYCYMVRIKAHSPHPGSKGLTAIFKITYHAKR